MTPTDATDNALTLPTSKPTTVLIDDAVSATITDHDPIGATPVAAARTNQQRIIPSAVKPAALGNFFSSQPDGTSPGTGTFLYNLIAVNTSTSFIFYVSDPQGRQIVAIPDVAFYVGALNPDSQWPNASFGMGNMPVSVFNDWGLTDNFNVATRAIMRNNSGVDQKVWCVCRHRVIANPGLTTGVPKKAPLPDFAPGLGGG